jgi:DNA-binding LacI/PurR family transcriptional regulator
MATIQQIAEEAGVSGTTVSRILNDVPGYTYAERTRSRVLEAARWLDYHPSPVARALVLRRTNVIAIAIREPDDPHYAIPLRRAHKMASAKGMTTTLVLPDSGMDLQALLQRGQADIGLLARGSLGNCESLEDALVASHQIVVVAGPRYSYPLPSGVRTAYWEEREGLRQGLEHLAELGHGSVTYLQGHHSNRPKMELARQEAERIGLAFEAVGLNEPAPRLREGAEMGRLAMEMRPRPTALFARTDEVAIGAIHAIYEAGLRVPEDISVMGHFDIPFAEFANPPLTTISTPFAECVEDVLQAALDALETGSREALVLENIRFPTRLVHRRSTAPPA